MGSRLNSGILRKHGI